MTSIPPEISELAKQVGANINNIKDLIVLSIAADKAKVGKEWIQERIRKFHEKRKYFGCVPNKELSLSLSKAEDTGAYEQLVNCVGSDYYLLSFFVMGLHIQELNREGKRKLVNKIRDEVYGRYKGMGLKLVEIGSTGALPSIIKHLTNLKIDENLGKAELRILLDDIVREWDMISIFIDKNQTVTDVEERIISKMVEGRDFFYVFGIGKPGTVTATAIANLIRRDELRKHGYFCLPEKDREEQPNGTPMFSWKFYKLGG